MVVVTVGDQTFRSKRIKKTLSPLWDEQFSFEFQRLTKTQLETMKITIEVIDKGIVDMFNSHLGGYEVDLTTVYFNQNHMFHKTWFTLFDFEENFEGCMGFVKATIEVLGPNDEPTIVEAITDDPSSERTVISAKIRPKGHMIVAEVYRAEFIAPVSLGSRYVNPYVKVKFGGIEKHSKKLSNTANPDFNQIMFIPVMLPNHSKNVYVELYDFGMLTDTLVGTAIVPFNCFRDSDNFRPLWINIYGPPSAASNAEAKIMAVNGHKSGTAFRGRILMRFSSHDDPNPVGNVLPMEFRLPEVVVPNPPSKTYILRVDIFEGNELPSKTNAIFHICIGPYCFKSSMKQIEKGKSQVVWNEELEDRRISLPMDLHQIPDIFVYFCDEDAESHRISYARLKAAEFVNFGNDGNSESKNRAKIIKFREDKTLKLLPEDAFPGFALLRIQLMAKTGVNRPRMIDYAARSARMLRDGRFTGGASAVLSEHTLYITLYVGRDLLSGEDDGTSNPRVTFKILGQTEHSKVHYCTLNPNFNQVIKFKFSHFQKDLMVPPTLIILVHHMVPGPKGDKVEALLGRYWLMLKLDQPKVWVNKDLRAPPGPDGLPQSKQVYFQAPKWVPLIYDRDEKIRGRLLMGYTLVEGEIDEQYFNIDPPGQFQTFTIYPFGFRDIHFNYLRKISRVSFSIGINNSEVEFDFMDKDVVGLFNTDKLPLAPSLGRLKEQDLIVENLSAYFNEKIRFRCKIPSKKELCPIMEVFLYLMDDKGTKKLLGIAQYELSKVLKHMYSEAEDRDYKYQWDMNFYLDRLNAKEEGRTKASRPKAQKFRAENQMIYNQNFVFDVQFPGDIRDKRAEKAGEGAGGVAGVADFYEQEPENEGQVILGVDKKVAKQGHGSGKVREEAAAASGTVAVPTETLKETKEKDPPRGLIIEREKDGNDRPMEIEMVEINKDDTVDLVDYNRMNPPVQPFIGEQREDFRPSANINPNLNQTLSDRYRPADPPNHGLPTILRSHPPGVTDSKQPMLASQAKLAALSKLAVQRAEVLPEAFGGAKEENGEQISRIDIQSTGQIDHFSNDFSKERLEYDDIFVKENEDALKKRQKKEKPSFFSRLALKNPFKGIFGRSKKKTVEYQDYDTDEEEEFDDVLPYLKGRKEFQTALENSLISDQIPKMMSKVGIYRAAWTDGNSLFSRPRKRRTKVALFKFLFIRENRPDLVPIRRIDKFLESITTSKEFNVRVYVLRGLQITSRTAQTPTTFLKFVMNGVTYHDTDSTREGIFPEYYRAKQFDKVTIPGTAMLRIEIWEKTLGFDSLLGYTSIDLEERVFSTNWQKLEKKPVEKRNIENDVYGSRGKLEMWIDIINPKSKEPMTVIFPKIQLEYELRVIIWDTIDCVHKDTIRKSNDLYARGNVMRGDAFQETDTHWICRNKGSFNWRWKFPVHLPVDENKNYGEDRFILQLWNRNLVSRDELIGEAEVDLNTHNMLKKSHIRRKAVQMRLREKGSGSETNMFWFEVFHPSVLDKYGNKVVQGRIRASFQVLPKEESEKFANASGRSNPNFYPTLPQPVGRFSFNLMNPCGTIRAIIGPDLCCRIICFCCLIVLLIVLVFVGYYVLTTFIGVQIAMAISDTTFATVQPANSTS